VELHPTFLEFDSFWALESGRTQVAITLQHIAYLIIKVPQNVAQRLLNRLIPVIRFVKINQSERFSQSVSCIG